MFVYFLGEYNSLGYPRYYYFKDFQSPFSPIVADKRLKYKKLSKKEFVSSLMKGEGFDG